MSQTGPLPKFKALIFRIQGIAPTEVAGAPGWESISLKPASEKSPELSSVTDFFSPWIRPNDLPRALLEKDIYMRDWAWTLEYVFEDNQVVSMDQILHHPWAHSVPKRLFPLIFNLKEELRMPLRRLNQPQRELMKCIQSCLVHAAFLQKELEFSLLFAFANQEKVLPLKKVALQNQAFGVWSLTPVRETEHLKTGFCEVRLLPPHIDPLDYFDSHLWLETLKSELVFHQLQNEFINMKTQILSPGHSIHEVKDDSFRAKGHAAIQLLRSELEEKLFSSGGRLIVEPPIQSMEAYDAYPRLKLYSNGTAHLSVQLKERGYFLQGLPQSLTYLMSALRYGLGHISGLPINQIAYSRRGQKRDRDLKFLKHYGAAALITYDALQFGLGLPLSSGETFAGEDDFVDSLMKRLGALILKSEGWPGKELDTASNLLSVGVIALVRGFIAQLLNDLRDREIEICTPEGAIRIRGLSRIYMTLIQALIEDQMLATQGTCFEKARLKFFEEFALEGPDAGSDLILSRDEDKHIETVFLRLPSSSQIPRGLSLLNLTQKSFEVVYNGMDVEDFDLTDFKSEFNVRENTETVSLGKASIDWFELHPQFFFRGEEISSEQASQISKDGMIAFQGKLYRLRLQDLPQVQRLSEFWNRLQGPALPAKTRGQGPQYYPLPRSQTLELLALRSSGADVKGGPRWQKICDFYDHLNDRPTDFELPSSLQVSLKDYQKISSRWLLDLYELGLGGILADDMGLGKTVTTLSFLESLRSQGRMGYCLTVVPTSLTYNWFSEARRFCPDMPVHIFSPKEKGSFEKFFEEHKEGLIITTYGLLTEHIDVLDSKIAWNCLIFDEAQNLKNISTKRTTSARKLRAQFKLGLTGTPLENHYGEFFSLLDLVVPGSLGDYAEYRERYVNPPSILRDELKLLRLKTKPLLMRRTKSEVMHELPPKVESVVTLPFEEQQRKIYRDIATSYNEQIKKTVAAQGEAKSQLQMLTALLRLRQACSDPSALPGVDYPHSPPKVVLLAQALKEITDTGESALVFTQFISTYQRITEQLTHYQIPHQMMNGATPRTAREKQIQTFNEFKGGNVMLMTLKTGGVGLNLTKATYIFHIEPWWNPAVENQATDRAHRIGQTKPVQVYRYIMQDSVEEKIQLLKDIKAKRFDALFVSGETEKEISHLSSQLTQKDFEYLVSLEKEQES